MSLSLTDGKPAEKPPLLAHEVELVQRDLDKLGAIQALHGALLGEAMEQSSETFHDNAPAEAIRDEQEVLIRRAKPLLYLLRQHVIIDYPDPDSPEVSAGSRVHLNNQEDEFTVDVVCYRPSDADDDILTQIITRETPLAGALMGNKKGNKIEFNGNTFTIVEVDQTSIAAKITPPNIT